jgi:hypothetical protein
MKLKDAIRAEWPEQADQVIGLITGQVYRVTSWGDWVETYGDRYGVQ